MKTKKIISLIFLLALFGSAVSIAKNPDSATKNSVLNKAAVQEWKFFDVNTIQATINSAGPYCDYLRTNSSGLFWPKGSSRTAVYTAGMWVIGKHRPTGALRTAVQDYSTEFQPGPILTTYNTSTNSVDALGDPADNRYRIYKVTRKDSVGGNPDYDNWPVDLGAPFVERNGTPGYQAGQDKPFLWGDQVLWCVYNDGNPSTHNATGKTNPMGIEIQTTYFGFDQPGALGNIMFMRWKIINKSDADYDSVFISMWSDTDLGDANDDLAAIDTVRKLAYVYNGDNDDAGASGYGSKPPACGFVFFQGPIVSGTATDTAFFEGEKRPGSKNLAGTSHAVYFNNGGAVGWDDPPLGNIAFAEEAYNYQNGTIGPTGSPFIDPDTQLPTKFAFPGDPVTGTGWLHTDTETPRDVRSMISSGPFTLAKGDTQEIVGGFVIAQGADRINSVSILRLYTGVAQEAFDVNFALASPPPQPQITVGDLPNKIILNWGNPTVYNATESYNFQGVAKDYNFEGYNIYQLDGPSSTSEAKLLATYDVVNGVKVVLDNVIDSETGLILSRPVVFGDDTGIKRSFVVEKDYITNGPLVNGKEYYFAVTSYAYNADPLGVTSGIPQVLENSKDVLTIIPRAVPAGDQFGGRVDQLLVSNRAINGDDAVTPTILDPRQLNGSQYKLFINGANENVTSWGIVRTTLSKGSSSQATDTVVNNVTDFAGSDASPIIDGIVWKVKNPTAGPRRDDQTPQGHSYTPAANLWFDAKQTNELMDAFGTSATIKGLAYPTIGNYVNKGTKVKPWNLKRVQIRFSNTNKQKAYRYLDNVLGGFVPTALRDPSFAPFLKHRGNGFVYQDFVEVPFTVWEIDSLDGVYTERQLNAGFLERNDTLRTSGGVFVGKGKIDGQWGPTTADNGGKEVLYIFASDYSADSLAAYTRNPNNPTNNGQFLNLRDQQDSVDVMYVLWVRALDTLVSFTDGDRFTIYPNYPLLSTTTFNIVAPKNITGDKNLVSEQVEKINVFPNPYFANNRAESNVYQRFVTFTNLPQVATIRIINLAGERIKTIVHNNTSGFERWDLRNESGLPVASGMYIAYIELPSAGSRVLKLAIIQPEERPAR